MKARFRQVSVAAILIVVLALSFAQVSVAQTSSTKPNVLFIVIDDLNDWVGYLGGNAQSPTPNLDRLARRGVRFTNAHASVTVCNPSRAAVLSGMRASTTGVYDNHIDWRPLIPEPKMITAQFRSADYWVAGNGGSEARPAVTATERKIQPIAFPGWRVAIRLPTPAKTSAIAQMMPLSETPEPPAA